MLPAPPHPLYRSPLHLSHTPSFLEMSPGLISLCSSGPLIWMAFQPQGQKGHHALHCQQHGGVLIPGCCWWCLRQAFPAGGNPAWPDCLSRPWPQVKSTPQELMQGPLRAEKQVPVWPAVEPRANISLQGIHCLRWETV